METEGNLLLVGLCPVSTITQKPNENPIAFLERLKETLQKFTNLDLDSYEAHGHVFTLQHHFLII